MQKPLDSVMPYELNLTPNNCSKRNRGYFEDDETSSRVSVMMTPVKMKKSATRHMATWLQKLLNKTYTSWWIKLTNYSLSSKLISETVIQKIEQLQPKSGRVYTERSERSDRSGVKLHRRHFTLFYNDDTKKKSPEKGGKGYKSEIDPSKDPWRI